MPTITGTPTFNSGVNGSSGDATTAFTVASGTTLMMVGVHIGLNALNPINNVTGVTWNTSESLSQIAASVSDDNNFEGVAWYSLVNPTVTTANVVLSVDSPFQWAVSIITFSGSSLTIETPNVSTGTSANPSITNGDSVADDTVLALMANDGSDSITAQSGTSIGSAYVDSDSRMASQYKVATGTNNTVMSWTMGATSASWALSTIAIHGTSPDVTLALSGSAATGGSGTHSPGTAVPL